MKGSRRAVMAIGVSLLAAAGCRAGGEGLPAAGAAAPPTVPVQTAVVERKTIPITVDAVGTAEAFSTVALHAQITGELTSVNFTEGDDVEKGQVLFTLDRRPLEAALQQARSQPRSATSRRRPTRGRRRNALPGSRRSAASRRSEQVDHVADHADGARRDGRRRSRGRREREGPAAVRDDHRADCRPDRRADGARGQSGRANDTAPLVVINQIAPIYVSFARPGSAAADAEALPGDGSRAGRRAAAPTTTAQPSVGRISFIDNAVDQTTGTIKIKGNVSERAIAGSGRGSSSTSRSRSATKPNAIVVPIGGRPGRDSRARTCSSSRRTRRSRLRPIEVGAQRGATDGRRNGLKPGETVVTDGQLRLVPGSQSAIKTADAAESKARMNLSALFIGRPVTTTLIMLGIAGVRHDGLPAAAGQRPADRRLPDDSGAGRLCRAPAPRRWRRRSRCRSRSSSRRLPASTRSTRPARRAARTSRCSST